ncbi:hypothetical protein DPMN_118127 [Dreissena polymorpha]|uniref:Uncharacterized protein n=1 Tax=Dreissena polymorpha TaxID=45954 RepID=A0A9D4GG68_DREPO|nr:hypothetical protein DPMN_118127 [Dreissena polymorpha]
MENHVRNLSSSFEQFSPDVLEKRRKLVPKMKNAKKRVSGLGSFMLPSTWTASL